MVKVITYLMMTILVLVMLPLVLTGSLFICLGTVLKSLGYLATMWDTKSAKVELRETADYLQNAYGYKED